MHQSAPNITAHLRELQVRATSDDTAPTVDLRCELSGNVQLVRRFVFSRQLPSWTQKEVTTTVAELFRLFSADGTFDVCAGSSAAVVACARFVGVLVHTVVSTMCRINANSARADVIASIKADGAIPGTVHGATVRMKTAVVKFARGCADPVPLWQLHATRPQLIDVVRPVAIWINQATAQESAHVLTYLISRFVRCVPDTVRVFGFRPGQVRTKTTTQQTYVQPNGARVVLKSIVATKNNDTRALVCFVPQHNPPMTATAQARVFRQFGSTVLQRGSLHMTVGSEVVVAANWACKEPKIVRVAFAAVSIHDILAPRLGN